MTSHADSALELYAAPQLARSFGVPVTLRRGAASSAALVATWSQHDYDITEPDGFSTLVQSRDYVLKAAETMIAGAVITPRAGDRIVDGSETFELMTLGKRPAAELLPGNYRWLVHTKRIV